ncbi:MAG: ATP-binding cassette domain-containing protein [Alphaproteobacteria bacterium]|nr:ATP-binding cassette domain-containing protein [Alphaproteobacteria bacterium]MCB9691643.1 ATP-binding cassette domain-containing protein [Alphaproteobacteria bacterium]
MIHLSGVTHRFADGTVGLDGVDLRVEPGERVLITGPSGAGKSTLLRVLAGLVAPTEGTVERPRTGLVFQEPGDQLLTGTVGEEVRLAARAAGRAVDARALLEEVGLDVPLHAAPTELSGGQQQRLAVAACLAGGAPVLLLDEPLAHLDGDGSAALLALLDARAAAGDAVILVEHRLEETLGWADRVLALRDGRLAPLEPTPDALHALGVRAPARIVLGGGDGLRTLGPRAPRSTDAAEPLWTGPLALHRGDRVALMGANGAGKSTLLEGLARDLGERAVWVPQDPDLSLFAATAAEELASGAAERGVPRTVTLEDLGLAGLGERAPQSLSRGQRLRLAVGAALATAPDVLLLDEPTAGQDARSVEAVMERVATLQSGRAVVFATHDLELALRWATRVAFVSEGRIVHEGPPGTALPERLPWLAASQLAAGFPVVDRDRQRTGPAHEGPVTVERLASSAPSRPPRPEKAATPVAAVLLLLFTSALAVLLERPFGLWTLVAGSLAVFLTRPIAPRTRRLALAGSVAILWSTLLSQGLFYGDLPRTPALRLGPVVLWWEGLRWGAVQSARLLSVGLAGLSLALTTSPDRLVGLLRALRVPGLLAFLAVMALRFVPVVGEEWGQVRAARARRGRALWRRGALGWLRAEVAMLQPLVARSLRRALRLAESLDSRGFALADPPVDAVPWTSRDRAVGAALCLALGGIGVLQGLQALYLWDVYYDPRLRPLYAWVRAWL